LIRHEKGQHPANLDTAATPRARMRSDRFAPACFAAMIRARVTLTRSLS